MSRLDDIAEALRVDLGEVYPTVRVTAVQTPEQFIQEIRAINPDRLPGVVIVFDGYTSAAREGSEEYRFTLVVIDRFVAGSGERARSVFKAGADLIDRFPRRGRKLGGVFIVPTDVAAASPDPNYAALALGIRALQKV